MSSKVSVIIPNFNHAAFLRQRIDSVLQQTVVPFEIIILDDCSVDNSPEIIKEYVTANPLIHFIANEVNSGSTFSQWNKGVTIAKGNLIWMAESDDVAEPVFLENLIACFESDPGIVLAYCQSSLIDAAGSVTGSGKTFTEGADESFFDKNFVMNGMEYIERFLIHRNTIPNASAVVFKKNIFEQAGVIPEQYKYTGDWLAWLKILCFGKIVFIAQPLNHFRRHPESIIAKAHRKEDKKIFKDWYGYDVRCSFLSFLKKNKIILPPAVEKINAAYMATDKGNLGLFYLRNGSFFKGWKLIFGASFHPTLQSGFIKKAIFEFGKEHAIPEVSK